MVQSVSYEYNKVNFEIQLSVSKTQQQYIFIEKISKLLYYSCEFNICDLPSENQPSSHLVVFREIPI